MFRSPSRPPRFTAWGLACVGCISLLPMTLSAQSTSLLPEQPPQPSAFGYPQGRATASASATARSSANSLGYSNRFGSGMGTGGNPNRRPPAFGYGHGLVPPQARSFGQAWAHAQAQARATVGQIARPPAHQEEPPTRSLWDPRGNRTSESPPQSTAAKEGLGQAWARSTQSVVNGETVTIEESQGRLAVTVERADGTRETTVASDPRQLADRSPSAARHYRQLVPPSSKHSGDPLSGEPPSDARVLLRQQLEALQASPEIRGRPLESLLDDVIRELP